MDAFHEGYALSKYLINEKECLFNLETIMKVTVTHIINCKER
jgi:hypothetical protein